MSLVFNKSVDVAESHIWNILIPSCLELPNDNDDANDYENEEDDEDNDDDEYDDLSLVPFESKETDSMC